MKRISYLLLLSIFLASCANVATSTPAFTETSIPTPTLAFTNTPQPTPTETPDPNMPDGATGKDIEGNYIKTVTENGKTFEVTWDIGRKAWYRQLYDGKLLDYSQYINENGMKQPDDLRIIVSLDSSIEGWASLPSLSHIPNTNTSNSIDFFTILNSDITTAILERKLVNDVSQIDFAKWNNHDFYMDFKNADGPQRWGLWPNTTINVHIRNDYDALQAATDTNGFSETRDYSIYGPENSFMIKIWTDDKGNLYCDIAPKLRPATAWTRKQLVEMILIGPLDALQYQDLTHPFSGGWLGEFVINANNLNYFEFGPTQ